jgi:hypothetical protein
MEPDQGRCGVAAAWMEADCPELTLLLLITGSPGQAPDPCLSASIALNAVAAAGDCSRMVQVKQTWQQW